MSARTGISWTDRTWNPVVGCTKVSQGCKHCYAKTLHDRRHKAVLKGKPQAPQYSQPFETVQLMYDRLTDPLSWRAPSRVFVNSVSDLFHETVPFEFIDLVFGIMMISPRHTYQLLTKRPARMREYFARLDAHKHKWPHVYQLHAATSDHFFSINSKESREHSNRVGREPFYGKDHTPWPLNNVWLGVSVENQAAADERIPLLLETPAAVRFLSCEPLLGPINVIDTVGHALLDQLGITYGGKVTRLSGVPAVDWVIAGGESGEGARPMHPDWARSLRDQCTGAGVAFHFKQWGEFREYELGGAEPQLTYTGTMEADVHAALAYKPVWVDARGRVFTDPDNLPAETPCRLLEHVGTRRAGRVLDGRTWDEFPEVRS